MKPAWEKVGGEYEASSSVVMGNVDCTVESAVCSKYGVQGYPTIKYFTPETASDGDKYQGGRDEESLRSFVKDKLEKACDIADIGACTEKEQTFFAKMQEKGAEMVQKQLTRLGKMVGSKMKAEQKAFLMQRLNILKQMAGGEE